MQAPPSVDFLLSLLEGVEIPRENYGEQYLELECRDGWKVVLFYDVDSLDYIDHFTTPDGEWINFWDWPASADKQRLVEWRGK